MFIQSRKEVGPELSVEVPYKTRQERKKGLITLAAR